jgi:hypothetical protein
MLRVTEGIRLDDRLKELLKELSDSINESISNSASVNDQIQKIRDEGYDLYVFLDATIGLGRDGEQTTVTHGQTVAHARGNVSEEAQFRINVNDLVFLRSVGIDPTRKVKIPKRLDGRKSGDDTDL